LQTLLVSQLLPAEHEPTHVQIGEQRADQLKPRGKARKKSPPCLDRCQNWLGIKATGRSI
jgi:hypothetical protein